MRRGDPVLALTLVVAGCSSAKKDEPPRAAAGMAALASASLAVRAEPPVPVPVLATAPPELPQKAQVKKPTDTADLIVTREKRARVEKLAPEAKGFLTSAELEEKLYKLAIKRGKDEDAVRALDRLAKGKWVLFTGNIGSPTPENFQLPVRYTPRDPGDSMGLTAVWLPIELSGIKGFDPSQYQPGDLAVVLSRYEGKQKASGGWDVVLLDHWFR